MSAQCRSCRADITWAVTERDKRIPVDAKPTPDGNLVLLGGGRGGAPMAVAFDPARHAGKQRFQSHWASCPNPKPFRRR